MGFEISVNSNPVVFNGTFPGFVSFNFQFEFEEMKNIKVVRSKSGFILSTNE